MILEFIQRIRNYEKLESSYEFQKVENGRKQEQIVELKKRIKELEASNDNTRKQKLCKSRSRQTKKI